MNSSQVTDLMDLFYDEWDSTPDIAKIMCLDDLDNLRFGEFGGGQLRSSNLSSNHYFAPNRTSLTAASLSDLAIKDSHQLLNELNGLNLPAHALDVSPLVTPRSLNYWDDSEMPLPPGLPIDLHSHKSPPSPSYSLFESSFPSSAVTSGRSSIFSPDSLAKLLQLNSPLPGYEDCLAFNKNCDQVSSPTYLPPFALSPRATSEKFGAGVSDDTVSVSTLGGIPHVECGIPNVESGIPHVDGGIPHVVEDSTASLEVSGAEAARVSESDFFMRKLGGFRNIGWTLNNRINELGQVEHRALVYSLHTFHSFSSPWMSDKNDALKAALTRCYEAEKGAHEFSDCVETPTMNGDVVLPSTPSSAKPTPDTTANSSVTPTPVASVNHSENGDVNQSISSRQTSLSSNPQSDQNSSSLSSAIVNLQSDNKVQNTVVLVWASHIPSRTSTDVITSTWKRLLPSTTRLLGVLKTRTPSQGLLIFQDLSSAIEFIRTAKSKQLECFDLLVAEDRQFCLPSVDRSLLFHPLTGDAIGFGLVNISPQHPTCIHTLLRLSQKDAVALGHKRTSTETLRLLLTHPEVSPVMVVPPAQPFGSYPMGRTTPVSQTPSHRRASIWCALCCNQSSDIPGAWKHLSRNPHEALRDGRNASVLEWVAAEHPALFAILAVDGRAEPGTAAEGKKVKEVAKPGKKFESSGKSAETTPPGIKHFNAEQQLKPVPASTICPKDLWSADREGDHKQHEAASSSMEQLLLLSNPKGLNPEAPAFVPGGSNLPSNPGATSVSTSEKWRIDQVEVSIQALGVTSKQQVDLGRDSNVRSALLP